MPTHSIQLQPKQKELLNLILHSKASVIGVGGGRGAAKSSGADRCAVSLLGLQQKTLMCMMMRNFDQVYKYHIEPIGRDFEWLENGIKKSMPASLTLGNSQMDFSYAENIDDIERRFRSGNYHYIFIDQAEQFSEREIREIRKATRMKGGGQAKIILLFNMRGGGIQMLRKWFYLKEFNKDEDPNDYAFIKFNPWDNIEWVRKPLAEDGYSEYDYYSWTDTQRKDYAAKRGPYTRQLATDDEVIRKADWEGDWDSLEGAYFANSFDLDKTRITPDEWIRFRKNWATHWMCQDWGRAHFCANYWNFRITLSPTEITRYLGWDWNHPDSLNVTVTYREMIVSEMESTDVARALIQCTPPDERKRIRAFFGSPDAFGVKDSVNTIASQQSKELHSEGMPGMREADNNRLAGWSLMSKLLKATKYRGIDPETDKPYSDVWFISSECKELLKAIPMAMRDPKNLDDISKTDKSQAKIEQDCLDACRYGLQTMLNPKKRTEQDIYIEKMDAAAPEERMMIALRHSMRKQSRKKPNLIPSWKSNL